MPESILRYFLEKATSRDVLITESELRGEFELCGVRRIIGAAVRISSTK